MNARTHQAYLTPDLWRALQHVAAARGVCVEEVLEDIAWQYLFASFPGLVNSMTERTEWLRKHDAEVRATIKKAIENRTQNL